MAVAYDFTSKAGIAASGVVVTRSGATVYPMLSASTCEAVGNNLPVFEDRGGPEGGGLWVWDNYQNLIASPFNMSTGWTLDAGVAVNNNVAVAPDGTTTAALIRDNSGVADQRVYRTASSISVLSGWFRLSPSDPAGAGIWLAADLAGTVSTTLALTTSWQRVIFRAEAPTHFAIIFDLLSQGAIEAWGMQRTSTDNDERRFALPLANGGSGTGMCTVAVPASDVAALMDPSGNYDIEVGCLTSADIKAYNDSQQANATFFHLVTTAGNITLRWSDTITGQLEARSLWVNVNGVDITHTGRPVTSVPRGNVGWMENHWVVARLYITPTSIRIRYRCNASMADDTIVTGLSLTLGTPLSCTIGSQGTTVGSTLKARLTHFEAFDDHTAMQSPEPCDILLLGDSTCAYINDSVGVGPCVASVAAAKAGFRIGNLCAGGDSVSGQTSKFAASAWTTDAALKARLQAVFMQGWINDINSSTPSVDPAYITNATNTLTANIKAAIPHARVVFLRALPADGVLDATDEQQYVDVANCAIGIPSGGGVALTGLAGVITSASDALNANGVMGPAGTNFLAAQYNTGDDLHQTNPGYQIIGDAIWAFYQTIVATDLEAALSGAGSLSAAVRRLGVRSVALGGQGLLDALATSMRVRSASLVGAGSVGATLNLVEPVPVESETRYAGAFRLKSRPSAGAGPSFRVGKR